MEDGASGRMHHLRFFEDFSAVAAGLPAGLGSRGFGGCPGRRIGRRQAVLRTSLILSILGKFCACVSVRPLAGNQVLTGAARRNQDPCLSTTSIPSTTSPKGAKPMPSRPRVISKVDEELGGAACSGQGGKDQPAAPYPLLHGIVVDLRLIPHLVDQRDAAFSPNCTTNPAHYAEEGGVGDAANQVEKRGCRTAEGRWTSHDEFAGTMVVKRALKTAGALAVSMAGLSSDGRGAAAAFWMRWIYGQRREPGLAMRGGGGERGGTADRMAFMATDYTNAARDVRRIAPLLRSRG